MTCSRHPLSTTLAALLAALGLSPSLACSDSADDQPGNGGANLNQAGSSGGTAGAAGAGAAGTAGAGAGGAAGAGGQVLGALCPDPTPWEGQESGWVYCSNEVFHKTGPSKCNPHERTEGPPSASVSCEYDSDCADLPDGRCYVNNGTPVYSSCERGCNTDEDCGTGEVCFCGEHTNYCIPAGCKQDSDCGEGFLCRSGQDGPCDPTADPWKIQCQSPQDECRTRKDCPRTTPVGAGGMGGMGLLACEYKETRWACTETPGTCGRPFLIEGLPRAALVSSRSGWLSDVPLPALPSSPELASRLASFWARNALLEHASVAAFARFSLQLLAFSAPASLVASASLAQLDEQRHASLCFSLASHFAQTPIGPGPLDLSGLLFQPDIHDFLTTNFLEGCIGETAAALEARLLSQQALDPALKQALELIAEDEQRHAELAWQTLRWAIAEGKTSADAMWNIYTREVARATEGAQGASDEGLVLEAGLPSEKWRMERRREALEQVVGPCLRALSRAEGWAKQPAP